MQTRSTPKRGRFLLWNFKSPELHDAVGSFTVSKKFATGKCLLKVARRLVIPLAGCAVKAVSTLAILAEPDAKAAGFSLIPRKVAAQLCFLELVPISKSLLTSMEFCTNHPLIKYLATDLKLISKSPAKY
jgi:hypothetical protein